MALALQLFLLLVLLALALFFSVQFFNLFFRSFAPYVSTKAKIIKEIVSRLELGKNSTVYELGCGNAGFLRAVRKKYPEAKLVGVEYSFMPYLIAQVQNALTKSRIKIIKKNIFKVDLAEADVIYCYLNIATMKKLKDKIMKEAKSGAVLISYQFPLPGVKAKEAFVDKNDRIYFYEIGVQ